MLRYEVVDLFCGAGGTTSGIHKAVVERKKIAKVVACVNHDTNAIASHSANHPKSKHFIENILTIDLNKLPRNTYKDNVHFVLWASLECTHFSNAKGGGSRDADSRTLATGLYRYIEYMDPDIIMIENVREFMSWGPLRAKQKRYKKGEERPTNYCELEINKKGEICYMPLDKKKGIDYLAWVAHIESMGYVYDHKLINSADLGAHTSRLRYFGIFHKPFIKAVFPEATHAKNPDKYPVGLFDKPLKKWRPVKEVLDFSDEGKSIFNRKKDYEVKSLERLYAGLIKHVAGGEEAFIAKYYSGDAEHMVQSVESPAGTVTTKDHHQLVSAKFMMQANGGNPASKVYSVNRPARVITTTPNQQLVSAFIAKWIGNDAKTGINSGCSIDDPSPVVATQNRLGLVQATFITNYYSGGGQTSSVDNPAPTLTTKDRVSLVTAKWWLDKNYSGPANHQSIEQPAGALTTKEKYSIVSPRFFLDKQYSSGTQNSSIDAPAGSLTTVPKMNLVEATPWIYNAQFDNKGTSIEQPAPTILACRKQHYLVNPQYSSAGSSVDAPCFTLIARMDKKPPYLVQTETGQAVIVIYEDDLPIMKKIKAFMALYGIVDIKMRMLRIKELLRIQGFDENYKLVGTQEEMKKFIGNAVVTIVPKKWFEALHAANRYFDRRSRPMEYKQAA